MCWLYPKNLCGRSEKFLTLAKSVSSSQPGGRDWFGLSAEVEEPVGEGVVSLPFSGCFSLWVACSCRGLVVEVKVRRECHADWPARAKLTLRKEWTAGEVCEDSQQSV